MGGVRGLKISIPVDETIRPLALVAADAAADPEGEAALAEKTSLGEETSLAEATTAIEILISMIDDRNWSEVERFLLAEKGFRSEQV